MANVVKTRTSGRGTTRQNRANASFEAKGTARSSPTAAQRNYLKRGLKQPGGKLPLFDDVGREINARTIRACIDNGWAEPWFANPQKTDWQVCRLTDKGYEALGADPKTK